MGEIFLAGVVVLLLIVMIDEYLEAYDEYMGDDEELQYGILIKIYHTRWLVTYLMLQI